MQTDFTRNFIHPINDAERNITREHRENFTSNAEFISAVVTYDPRPAQQLQWQQTLRH